MKNATSLALVLTGVLVLVGCARELNSAPDTAGSGSIRIDLSRDARNTIASTKAPGMLEEAELPPVDDFEVEIYNASNIRLYRKNYAEAKGETIRLNAGTYRLVAHHGDTLGAGFGKAYFLADQLFTVHGYVENGGEPDRVAATAKLANVKVAVSYGENLRTSYADYRAVVRHNRYTGKQVNFSKDETRAGYMPGGELYLEVYADRGADAGGIGYFKTEPVAYDPNDFVTFQIETGERYGDLLVNITVDREVEEFQESVTIPASALPSDPPVFSHRETVADSYDYPVVIGPGNSVNDALVSFHANGGLKSVKLDIVSDYLTSTLGLPASFDIMAAGTNDIAKFTNAGITWVAINDATYGCIDFCSVVKALSLNAALDPENPVIASFTITAADKYGKQSSAVFNLVGTPVQATVAVADYDIWGWKMVAPVATLTNVKTLAAGANVKLQYSADGSSWQSVTAKTIEGNKVTFNDLTGLTAGTQYQLRTLFNDDSNNVSTPSLLTTETPAQVGNSGFEEYTEQTFTTDVVLWSDWDIPWWQLYKTDRWWAVNSPVTLNSSCATAYQDYKSFPTVSLTTSNAYDGHSVIIATTAIGDATSEIAYGDYYYGEIFLGTANDKNEGSWAKTAEGHAFTSRPSALAMMHKFDSNGKPYYVSVKVYDAAGNEIGSGLQNSQSASVNAWTALTVPLTYSQTKAKAASLRIDIRSSYDSSDNGHRSVTIQTLSGSHKIHAGNILYVDNIELKYE